MNTTPQEGIRSVAAAAISTPKEALALRLSTEEYRIDKLRLQEFRSLEAPTRIAIALDEILGVNHLRDLIVPKADLRLALNAAFKRGGLAVDLSVGGLSAGHVVDGVGDVVELGEDEVSPAPAFNGVVADTHIQGIATLERARLQRMLILVDIQEPMNGAEMGSVVKRPH